MSEPIWQQIVALGLQVPESEWIAYENAKRGWRPIETVPFGTAERFWFWLVPKTAAEAPTDTSGRPIVSRAEPYGFIGTKGAWPALMKPTHWMPLPLPPLGGGTGAE